MATVKSVVGKFMEYLKREDMWDPLKGITWIALLAVFEEILDHFAFTCPCENIMNKVFSSLYIVGPASVIIFIGVLRLECLFEAKEYCCNCRGQECNEIFKHPNNKFPALFFVPISWLFIVFLDGDYFACAHSVKPYDSACSDVIAKKNVQFSEEYLHNKDISKEIAWIGLLIIIVTYTLFKICVVCCKYQGVTWKKMLGRVEYFRYKKAVEENERKELMKELVTYLPMDRRDFGTKKKDFKNLTGLKDERFQDHNAVGGAGDQAQPGTAQPVTAGPSGREDPPAKTKEKKRMKPLLKKKTGEKDSLMANQHQVEE